MELNENEIITLSRMWERVYSERMATIPEKALFERVEKEAEEASYRQAIMQEYQNAEDKEDYFGEMDGTFSFGDGPETYGEAFYKGLRRAFEAIKAQRIKEGLL